MVRHDGRRSRDARLNALFDQLSEALLADSPESATALALYKGKRAGQRPD
jgi:hypothetical protein